MTDWFFIVLMILALAAAFLAGAAVGTNLVLRDWRRSVMERGRHGLEEPPPQ
jgi:hypothetical protein